MMSRGDVWVWCEVVGDGGGGLDRRMDVSRWSMIVGQVVWCGWQ